MLLFQMKTFPLQNKPSHKCIQPCNYTSPEIPDLLKLEIAGTRVFHSPENMSLNHT